MATYIVECEGEVREVYAVEASSPEEAMNRWHHGRLVNSEARGVEAVAAELDE